MTGTRSDQGAPVDRVGDLRTIQEAMARGVRDALRRHKQAGNAVAVWRDGAVVWVTPADILVDDEPVPKASG